MKRHTNMNGFTLIEIMIVVAIIAVIMAFGYPSYLKQMENSRRTDAKVALVTLAQLQESFYVDSGNTYAATLVGDNSLGCDNKGLCKKSGSAAFSLEGYYTLTVAAGSTNALATSFKLTATARADGAQKNDSNCQTFTFDSLGQKGGGNADGDAHDCW